jgi:hypothetical protein
MSKKKTVKPIISYQQLDFDKKTKIKVGIWAGDIPENLPDWFTESWIDKTKFCWIMEISGKQVLELLNLGIEVRLTHSSENGELQLWIDKVGRGFSIIHLFNSCSRL